jgi:hypothetical protein
VTRSDALRFALGAASTCQAVLFSWPTALAQSMRDVVGTWTLVSSVTEKDGTKTDQFGPGLASIR